MCPDNHNLMFSIGDYAYHNGEAQSTHYAENGNTVYYILEEATDYTTNVVKVNAASNIAGIDGICTYSAPYAVTLPTGYQAWYVAAAPEGVTLLPATSETPASLDGNQLVGTGNDGNTLAAGDYILTDGKFYPIDPANAAVAAHKAYLHTAGAGAPSLVLSFGETDAIKAVESVKGQKAPIYDMQGRRVQKAVKGLYIQGGKKFMVK